MTNQSTEAIRKVIVTNIGGDFRLRGEGGPQSFQIKADGPHLQQDSDVVTIMAGGDCVLICGEETTTDLGNIGGDAKITQLNAPLSLKNVGGDLFMRHIESPVRVGSVGGDLAVRHVDGNLTVNAVGGDMDCRDIDADVKLNAVGGDLSLRDISGSCVCLEVGGDMLVGLDFFPENAYSFTAKGEILFRLDEDPNIKFILPLGRDYDLDNFEATVEEDGDYIHITLGDGAAVVNVDAEKGMYLTDRESKKRRFAFNFDFDMPEIPEPPLPPEPPFGISIDDEPLGEFISRQVNDALSGIAEVKRKKHHFERDVEREHKRIRREAAKASREAARAGREAARASREAARMHRHSRGRHEHPSGEEVAPVSDQERLMILNMLEEGKISVEEAEALLRTMEGR